MSKETLEWLNNHTLIGFSDELGKAWHHRDGASNHFDGPVPIGKVEGLFSWNAIEAPLYVEVSEGDGIYSQILAEKFKAILHPDTGEIFNITSQGYVIHQYIEWLVEEVQALLDESAGELQIGTAGLLRGGAQAWVQVRPKDTLMVGGEEQLPWILATTSHDGSLATQYKGQRQRVVCDNTLAVGLGERSSEYRIKHTKNSRLKLAEAREALEMIYRADEQFDAEIQRWMNSPFNSAMFRDLNNTLIPEIVPEVDDGKIKNQRAINNRDAKIGVLEELWFNDERVTPYKDTQWGAMMAHNTWFHWGRTYGVGDDTSLMKPRQVLSSITGDTDAYDRKVRRTMDELVEVG